MKILITSFEPHGFSRKNISKEVAFLLEEILPDLIKSGEIEFVTLPVNDESASTLKAFLKFIKPSPDVIISMGQSGFGNGFRIESAASDMSIDRIRKEYWLHNKTKVESDLAKYIALTLKLPLTNKIGHDQCNAVYAEALRYGQHNAIFCHIGSRADKRNVARIMLEIIDKCKEVLKDG